jgi:hypothetical protein
MRYLGKPRWSREDQPFVKRTLVLVVCFYTTGLLLTGGVFYLKNALETGSGSTISAQASSLR